MKHYLYLLSLIVNINLTQQGFAQDFMPLLESDNLEILISPDQETLELNGQIQTQGKVLRNQLEKVPSTIDYDENITKQAEYFNHTQFYYHRTLDGNTLEFLPKRLPQSPDNTFVYQSKLHYNTQNGCLYYYVSYGLKKQHCLSHVTTHIDDEAYPTLVREKLLTLYEFLYQGSYQHCMDS